MNYKLLKDIDPNWSFSKLRLDVRREHTDLSTPCQPSQYKTISGGRKRIRKNLILHLGLTKELVKGMHSCHLCACDTHHGCCQNLAHVYFGSPSENAFDTTKGHDHHDLPLTGALGTHDEPYCPTCGYMSSAANTQTKRKVVHRHIKRKSCNISPWIKRKTHAAFAAKGERV